MIVMGISQGNVWIRMIVFVPWVEAPHLRLARSAPHAVPRSLAMQGRSDPDAARAAIATPPKQCHKHGIAATLIKAQLTCVAGLIICDPCNQEMA
jgi:hypothetical protein